MGGLGARLAGFVAVASSHPKATPASEVATMGNGAAGDDAPAWGVAQSMPEALGLAAAALGEQAVPASRQLVRI